MPQLTNGGTSLQPLAKPLTTSDFNSVAKIFAAASLVTEVVTPQGVQIVDSRPPEVKPIKALAREGLQTSPLLINMLNNLQHSLGVSKAMTADLLAETIGGLVETYPWLSVADFQLVFTRAKRGVYGEMYERLSMPKIFGWFREYAEERATAAEQANYQKHLQTKTGEFSRENIDLAKWYEEAMKKQEEAVSEPNNAPLTPQQSKRLRDIVESMYGDDAQTAPDVNEQQPL